MRIQWSRRALRELVEIGQYVAEYNPESAKRLTQKINQRVKRLARFPHMGRRVPEYGDNSIREVMEGQYRIVYYLEEEIVYIVTITRTSQILRIDEPQDGDE